MPGSLAAAALAALLAQAIVPPDDAAPAPPDAAAPADAASLALRSVDDRLTVDVRLNGAGPFRFLVDSGATRKAPAPPGDEIVVLARRRRGQLVLADASASGQRVWAVVDSGSMTTIGNPVLRDRLAARRRAAPQTVPITDVAGRTILGAWAVLPDLRLNAWRLLAVPVAFADAHAFARFGLSGRPAMLLGMDVMRAFSRVSIDFRDRSVRFTRRHPG